MADLDAIRGQVNLADVVGETVELRRSGNQWVGKCPAHDDRSASLSVSEKLYHCFVPGCISGDLFGWLQYIHHCDFAQALAIAQNLAGLPQVKASQSKTTNKPKALKLIPLGVAEQFHIDLTPARREYYRQRGLTDETIDYFKLGWDGTRYTIPVMVGGQVVNIRRRRDDANRREKGEKMLNTAGFGTATVFNQDCLKAAETVIIAEGEFDTMLLVQHGWTAVCGTAGCGTFKPEWLSLFASKRVYVCYDNDLAGNSGAAKVAALFGERARIVTLPEEVGEAGDVTDFFVRLGYTDADFEGLLQTAKPYESPPAVPEEGARAVHLAQSAHSDLVGKQVEVKVLVAGKLDAPYIVPRKVRYNCYASDKERELCGAADDDERRGGYWDRTFDDSDAIFIELCHKRKDQLGHVLRTAAGCQFNCKKFSYQVLDYVNVEEMLAVPMAERVLPSVSSNGHKASLDESGNEYVARNLYLLNAKAIVNSHYKVTGRVYPHPNTQLGTILITQQDAMQDSIAQFALTKETRELLEVFQAGPNDDLVGHIQGLLNDLTSNVTRIYKRDEALLAVLLGYHSVLNFEFEGRPLRRGWLETLLLGDTGLGKTELVRSLIEFIGLGTLVSGETSRRTGLCYSVQQVGERWFVKWGAYVLNDRRLLAIDELSELPEEDLGRMTQGRNDGVMRVEQAGVGEANCRTRLIWMSNPRFKKGLYDFSHGIEALKTLFPTPADLRRLDLAVFLANKDIDLAEINQVRPKAERQRITSEALRQSVLWAWSRGISDVVIDETATKAILTEASRLSGLYGAAEDVPLVSPADMRNKLARLCVALAALIHSSDADHEKVLVKPLHIQFIGAFLDSVYQAKNCRYEMYAGYAAAKSTLDDLETQAITAELNAIDSSQLGLVSTISGDVLTLYRQHDVLMAHEIGDLLDLDRRTVTKRIKVLQKHGLLRKTKHGFHKTPKFVEYLSAS